MFSRMAGVFVLAGAIMCGGLGVAWAQPISTTSGLPHPSPNAVPEFDPNALGSAVAMLTGGVFLLAERRRSHK
jgi:hypothetical protein